MAAKKKRAKRKHHLASIDDLKPASYNPRSIKANAAAGLGESLEQFGDISGVVWNARTGNLVCGHQRVEQLRKQGAELEDGALGLDGKRWPVRVVDWTLEREKTANVAANNPHIAGEFSDGLGDILTDIKLSIGDEDFTGLRFDDLEKGLPQEINQDEVPEPPKKPIAKTGDVWALGRHRVVCGDSADPKHVEMAINGSRAYLMVTDPPYGVDFEGQKYNPRAKAWAGIDGDDKGGADLTDWLLGVLLCWLPMMHKSAAFYFWTAAMAEGAAAAAAIRNAGLHIQSQIIWTKNALILGQADYQWRHENCWYAFWKGKKHRWFGKRSQTTVWEISKIAHGDYQHPMQKPVELYSRAIQNHTKTGETVFDPFLGSGTQIIAAEQLDRICHGVEISPAYCDVIVERWQNLTGGKAKRKKA